jgi:F-type H+-transporting ATPase subunit gamma
MASVLDLRRRIRSVKNTRQITKAMKMVSAAKLRRAQERALSIRPYGKRIAAVLESLKRRAEIFDPVTGDLRHPLFLTRPEKNVLLIVISGDKGFAGAFNTNILKAASGFLDANTELSIDVEPIGRKAREAYRRRYPVASYTESIDEESRKRHKRDRQRTIEVVGDHVGLLTDPTSERVFALARSIISRYVNAEIDACYVVFNEFKSVIQQRVIVQKLLPLVESGEQPIVSAAELSIEERERAAEAAATAGVSIRAAVVDELAEQEAKKFGTATVDYIYEQSARELYDALLPQYVAVQLYHAIVESTAAEHAARMTAMDSATNNASDMIDTLTLHMNRVRQAAITKEIIEIVSGAAAL